MNTILEYLNLVVGVFTVIVGGFVPLYDLIQAGSIGCSAALGFGIFAAGVILLCGTFFIAKSSHNKKFLYFLAALIVSYLILIVFQYIVQWLYGLVGQFDTCTLFVG